MTSDSFKTRGSLQAGGKTYEVFSLDVLAKSHPAVRQLPFSLKVLLENLLRHEDGRVVKREHVEKMLAWDPKAAPDTEISFHPARVLLQDFTGVPAVVDLAAMREALAALGGDPQAHQPADTRRTWSSTTRSRWTTSARAAPSSATRSWSSSATASATRSCAGARTRSRTSAWCRRTPASATR